MRQSIPRQVDKKSGVPEEEKGVWGSQGGERGLGLTRRKESGLELSRRRKGQAFFFKPRADDYTTKQLSLNSMLRII